MMVNTRCGSRVVPVTAVCLALVGVVPSASAQRISMGPRLGVGLSTVRFEEPNADNQQDIRAGFHVGVSGMMVLNRAFSAEASLLYGQGGYARQSGMPGSLATDYVELPVLVRVQLPARISPHLGVGLAPRIRVRCRLTDVALVEVTGCDDPLVGREWSTFDLGGVVGLGADIALGRGVLVLDARFTAGLLDPGKGALPPGRTRTIGLRISSAFLLQVG